MDVVKNLRELCKRNKSKTWENRDIYKLMYRPELYDMAHKEISKNTGSNTPGIDGKHRGHFSSTTRDTIIEQMRSQRYHFKPAKRTYILKPNGKQRPLGIPTYQDRVVEKAMLILLECIYDPKDENANSYGFIKERSCQQIAMRLRLEITKYKYVIEGDFKSAFDNVSHDHIIATLSKRIKDQRFLNLIKRRLNAGYIEKKQLHKPNVGTPQGGILSPFLFNRSMDIFDDMMDKIQQNHTKGKQKTSFQNNKSSRERIKIDKRIKSNPEEKDQLVKEWKGLQKSGFEYYTMKVDPEATKASWIRYADDWILLFSGPKNQLEQMLMQVRELSASTGVDLNDDKTIITDTQTGFNFLGYQFSVTKSLKKITKKKASHTQRASLTRRIYQAHVNVDKRSIQRLTDKKFCDKTGFPIEKRIWQTCSDEIIIKQFAAVWRGLKNYYAVCDSGSRRIWRMQYILQYSCLKTLAAKHNTSIRKVIAKYGLYPRYKDAAFPHFKASDIPGFAWKPKAQQSVEDFDSAMRTASYTRVTNSKGSSCEACGESKDLHSHHKRKMRYADWDNLLKMLKSAHNRDQITLCASCHRSRHN